MPELYIDSTNVVSANAARPNGPGSATDHVVASVAARVSAIRPVVGSRRAMVPASIGYLPLSARPGIGIELVREAQRSLWTRTSRSSARQPRRRQAPDSPQPRRLRLRFLEEGCGLPAGVLCAIS